jgi:hypothetical protein
MDDISMSTPHAAYGGVTLGGGGGIIVAELVGRPDQGLARAIRHARAAGVQVQELSVERSLAELEGLADRGAFRRLPLALRDHGTMTQVDVIGNRVIVGFDLPLDLALRADVASTFGSAVAVARADVVRWADPHVLTPGRAAAGSPASVPGGARGA